MIPGPLFPPEEPIEPVVEAPPAPPQPILRPVGDVSALMRSGIALQEEATKVGIHNVFDDNGYKDMLVLRLFGLKKLGREGDDAIDSEGRTYETKTVARVSSRGVRKERLGVTTEHTLTLANIRRYRSVFLWIIAVFDQAVPEVVFEITPAKLEPYFAKWEAELRAMEARGIPAIKNNPKIPLEFVLKNGVKVYPT